MALIDKLKAAGEQATAAARESMKQAELNHDLNQAYNDLGRMTFALVQQGALSDERLAAAAERIHELGVQAETLGHGTRVSAECDDHGEIVGRTA
jgi:hypothetical protein